MVPSDPPGVLRVPILGPNRGMFSKLNGPSPLGSGGHSYTSFSIGRFYAQWNSFGGDVVLKLDLKQGLNWLGWFLNFFKTGFEFGKLVKKKLVILIILGTLAIRVAK